MPYIAIKVSLDCGGRCENCSSCWLGGGNPWEIYRDYRVEDL